MNDADGAPDDPAEPNASETSIDAAVIDRVGDETGTSVADLTDALTVLHADLIGRHSTLERDHEYVTVGGRRAYVVDEGEWRSLTGDLDLDDDVADAARRAHTEQARLLDEASMTDLRVDDGVGVVVGVDTAEEMN